MTDINNPFDDFVRMRPALGRFLAARGAQRSEVDDLLQDMFLRLGKVDGSVVDIQAYLYRMANNLMLDLRRSAARRGGRERAWTGAQSHDVVEIDQRPSAEDILLARERLGAVQRAIAALPDRTVDIFRRYRLGGEAQKEIAADLGLSVSSIEKHLQRAYRVVVAARATYDADADEPRRHSDEGDDRGD